MKLITLNTWGGRIKQGFSDFFKRYPGIDAWLFQEVYNLKKEEEWVKVGGNLMPDFQLNDTIAYVFVSPGIKVKEFKVLPDVVSDHAPLFLDFEVV
ncbi:MAG TPA: hypothetical protein VFQ72_03260 [Candidatus Paceibacterota bacterium]|nr:hypothetical protein [Candidatus Paceibacterota bacterium]